MFRSAFGIILLLVLATALFVQLGVRAEVASSASDRVAGTGELLTTGAVMANHLDQAQAAAGPGSPASRRRFGGEPVTLLLLGVGLFGAAHYARRPGRADR